MAARRSNVSRGTGPNRKFVWARTDVTASITDGLQNQDLLAPFKAAYGADILGSTIMRIRGRVAVSAGPAQPSTVIMASRIYAETDAPVPQIYGPVSQPEADWMLYEALALVNGHSFEVDTKASRKMEEFGQGLMLSLETSTPGVQFTLDGFLSVGLKLP